MNFQHGTMYMKYEVDHFPLPPLDNGEWSKGG